MLSAWWAGASHIVAMRIPSEVPLAALTHANVGLGEVQSLVAGPTLEPNRSEKSPCGKTLTTVTIFS